MVGAAATGTAVTSDGWSMDDRVLTATLTVTVTAFYGIDKPFPGGPIYLTSSSQSAWVTAYAGPLRMTLQASPTVVPEPMGSAWPAGACAAALRRRRR